MDSQEVLRILEEASYGLQHGNVEQRHSAEQVFISFRKTPNPFALCQFLLENSKVAYVIFETGKTLQIAVVSEWASISLTMAVELQSYLLHYLVKSSNLESFAQRQIMQTLSVLLKRGYLDDEYNNLRADYFQQMQQALSSSEIPMKELGCSLLQCFVNEFSGPTSTAVGFTWEFHDKCKRKFEKTHMRDIFTQVFTTLSVCIGDGSCIEGRLITLLSRLLEKLLSWKFSPVYRAKVLVGSFKEEADDIWLRPGESWRAILLDPIVTQLLFENYGKIQHEGIKNSFRNSIIQMSTLSGTIFENHQQNIDYLARVTFLVMELMTKFDANVLSQLPYQQLEITTAEIWCCSTSIDHLISNFEQFSKKRSFEGNVYLSLAQLFGPLMNILQKLTSDCLKVASRDVEDQNNMWLMECYDLLLKSWLTMISDSSFPKSEAQPFVFQLFQQYIISKLEIVSTENDEFHEEEEDDIVVYEDQLNAIAFLGRECPQESIPFLTLYINETLGTLSNPNISEQERIPALGRMHWLLLITGFTIADSGKGEKPEIPETLYNYSLQNDGLAQLIDSLFAVMSYETEFLNNNGKHLLSTLVASSLVWVMGRFSKSYLDSYTTEKGSFLEKYSHHSTDGRNHIYFLMQKLISNFSNWSEDESICNDTGTAMLSICEIEPVALLIYCSDVYVELNKIVQHFTLPSASLSLTSRSLSSSSSSLLSIATLPLNSRLLIAQSCLTIASTSTEDVVNHVSACIEPICGRLQQIVRDENFVKNSQLPDVTRQVIALCEILRGFSRATSSSNWRILYDFFRSTLPELLHLVHTYHTCPEICYYVLHLLVEYVEYIITFIDKEQIPEISNLCLRLLEIYNQDHRREKSSDNTYEFQNSDLTMFVKLLTALVSKDFLDFGDGEIQVLPDESDKSSTVISSVVLQGINFLLPLMTEDLFQTPTTCAEYFDLISFMCCNYSENIASLDMSLMGALMTHVKDGLTMYGEKVAMVCFEAIDSLGTYAVTVQIDYANQKSVKIVPENLSNVLTSFQEIIFRLVLLEDFDLDSLDTAAEALWPLIIFNQARYQELSNNLMLTHTENQERLASAFRMVLSENNIVEVARLNTLNSRVCVGVAAKRAFRKNFQNLVMDVRGFLRTN